MYLAKECSLIDQMKIEILTEISQIVHVVLSMNLLILKSATEKNSFFKVLLLSFNIGKPELVIEDEYSGLVNSDY